MLAPTSIKDTLNQTAPVEKIQVQGWVRTRRDAKDFSFIELNDGSSLRNLQIIARNSLPNYAAIERLMAGASIIVGGALVASQGKMKVIRCKRKGILRNSCARSPTCARARIFLVAFFAFAAGSPSPFINSFKSAVFTTFTHRSLRGATAKERANYFV